VRRPSLDDVHRATDQFLRTALASRGVGDTEFGHLEAELADRRAKDTLPRLVLAKKGTFQTPDGKYRVVKTKTSVRTASKHQDNGKYAKVAEAATCHRCWALVLRLMLLEDRPTA
jgi:hypothetical protein